MNAEPAKPLTAWQLFTALLSSTEYKQASSEGRQALLLEDIAGRLARMEDNQGVIRPDLSADEQIQTLVPSARIYKTSDEKGKKK